METKKIELGNQVKDLIIKTENANERIIKIIASSIVPASKGFVIIKICTSNGDLEKKLKNENLSLEERVIAGLQIINNISKINAILNYEL